jgi:MFS family permease
VLRRSSLLVDRTFGPYFFGNLTSNIGTWFQQVAAAVVVHRLTGSSTMVGMVGAAQFAPALLLAPWTGAAADRFDRRRLLIAAQSLAFVAAACLAVWTLAVGVDGLPGPWPVMATALLIGLGNALSIPAQQALVPALVSPELLDEAVALNSVTFNLARAVGPALGGVVLVALGAGVAFAVNAVTYLALVGALMVIRPRPVQRAGSSTSVWVGIRYLRHDSTAAVLLGAVALLGIGADPIITLSPALSHLMASGSDADALVGYLVSAFGLGAVLATTSIRRLRRAGVVRASSLGLGLLALGVAGLSWAPTPLPALAAALVAGGGFLLGVTSLTAALHQRIPEELRGRVMALWGVAFLGSRPVAALADGYLADLVGPRPTALVAALVVFLGSRFFVRRLT